MREGFPDKLRDLTWSKSSAGRLITQWSHATSEKLKETEGTVAAL
jgi:hypothetical protein